MWSSLGQRCTRAYRLARLIAEQRHASATELTLAKRAELQRDGCDKATRLLNLEIEHTGTLPAVPSLLVANHLSYLDPVVIASQISCAALAKHEAESWPALGSLLKQLGVIFVKREDRVSRTLALRGALERLRAGVSVLVFPEGTTTLGEDVLPFHVGAFQIAKVARVPVVPIFLRYSTREVCWVGDDQFLPHLWKVFGLEKINVSLHFENALLPSAADPKIVAETSRDLIRKHALQTY